MATTTLPDAEIIEPKPTTTKYVYSFGGVLPLVIATGAGAEIRRALGQAVFSGMLGVTFFGIFLTPVFFYAIRRFGRSPSDSATR